MLDYNTSNPCCCTYGMKFALCILQNLINQMDIISSYEFFTTCGVFDGTLLESRYPNFVFLQKEGTPNDEDDIPIINTNFCIDSIEYIKITPETNQYMQIINELNKNYISPSVLLLNCNENCCCKESAAAFIKDKYLKCNWNNRVFRVRFNGEDSIIPPVPENPDEVQGFVTVIHMDYDIAWLFDNQTKVFYIVSLCKICALIDISLSEE